MSKPGLLRSFAPLLVACACTAGLAALFASEASSGWPESAGAIGAPSDYCERAHAGGLREPANALSSGLFALAGLVVLAVAGGDAWRGRPRRNPMVGLGPAPIAFAAGMILLGFGSAFYHASETALGGKVDVVAMLMVMAFPLFYNVARLRGFGEARFAAAFLAFVTATLAYFAYDDRRSVEVAHVVVLLALVSEIVTHLPSSPVRRSRGATYWLGVVAMGVSARLVWSLSRRGGALCDPDALAQGHALWHALCAFGLPLYYLDFRSEAPARAPRPAAALDAALDDAPPGSVRAP
jgi:hypothetical protein